MTSVRHVLRCRCFQAPSFQSQFRLSESSSDLSSVTFSDSGVVCRSAESSVCAAFISGGAIVFDSPVCGIGTASVSRTSPVRKACISSSKSTSRCHVDLNSLVVLRKSAIVLPMVFAICGSLRGPRKIRAIIPIRISSEVPMDSRIKRYTLLVRQMLLRNFYQVITLLMDAADEPCFRYFGQELVGLFRGDTYQQTACCLRIEQRALHI